MCFFWVGSSSFTALKRFQVEAMWPNQVAVGTVTFLSGLKFIPTVTTIASAFTRYS